VHNCNDIKPSVSLSVPPTCDTTCTITATVTAGTHPLTDERYAQYPGTVTFTLNGNVIHTEHVSDSPSTISFPYTPSSTGSGTVRVDVLDSVLYGSSDSASMSYNTAPVPKVLTLVLGAHNGNGATFSWNDTGSSTYTLCYSGFSTGCAAPTTGTSTTIPAGLQPNKNYTATLSSTSPTSTSNTISWTQEP